MDGPRMEVKYVPVAGQDRNDGDEEVGRTGGLVEMKKPDSAEKTKTTQTEEAGSRSFLYIAACAGQ